MGISVWLANWMLPLALLALLFVMAALSFAWGVRGQRAVHVEAAELAEGGKVARIGRLERVYGVMMWIMVICCAASLAAVGVGLSALS